MQSLPPPFSASLFLAPLWNIKSRHEAEGLSVVGLIEQ